MREITFHYDASRTPHVHILNWLRRQGTYVGVDYVNIRGSGKLDHGPCGTNSFWAVGDDGSVYCGRKAWLMVLWVTYHHRLTAIKLAASGKYGRAIEVLYRLARV